ncbi:MAG: M23 family metallopeptidase [Hyphomonadaceae bacterium]
MKKLWLAACAVGMLAAAPAQAIEIRVDPAPLYVFDLAPDRGAIDLVLHNILVVNDENQAHQLTGLRVELLKDGEIVAASHVGADALQRRAQRLAGYAQAGLLQAMDFQFHLGRNLHEGESLSTDATLEPGEAFLNTAFYIASSTLPDTARVVAESAGADIGSANVSVSRYQSPNHYRAPVDGRWFVWASGDAAHHHRWVVSSEYAIDIAQLGPEMRSHTGDGSRLRQYRTFGLPIRAAADGVVVAVHNDRIDNEGMLRQRNESYEAYEARAQEFQQTMLLSGGGFDAAAGNYVLIAHEGGEHTLYAHMRQGSVRVRPGQRVAAGDQIGEAGTSGNSTEPHLHFQVIDGPDLNTARGLPIVFEGLRDDWIAMGGRQLRAGDVIERD